MILANLLSSIFIFFSIKGWIYFNTSYISITYFFEMTKFSVPLVPNSIMWWLINGATRYFILYFVGSSGNGLYAVANKIPTIISTFQVIFSQSWQLSSFEEFNSEDRDLYYTNVFNFYASLLFILGSFLLVIVKPIIIIMSSESYFISWQIVPFLLLGVIFQGFSNFLGMIYTAAKVTKKVFATSVYGGLASLILNSILVPIWGVIGAGIATAISFFVMFLYRLFDTKKIVVISIDKRVFLLNLLIYLVQIIFLFIFDGVFLYSLEIISLLIVCFVNRSYLIKICTSSAALLSSVIKRKKN